MITEAGKKRLWAPAACGDGKGPGDERTTWRTWQGEENAEGEESERVKTHQVGREEVRKQFSGRLPQNPATGYLPLNTLGLYFGHS